MRGEVGKKTSEKEMDNGRIFMTSHMTLSADPFSTYIFRTKISQKKLNHTHKQTLVHLNSILSLDRKMFKLKYLFCIIENIIFVALLLINSILSFICVLNNAKFVIVFQSFNLFLLKYIENKKDKRLNGSNYFTIFNLTVLILCPTAVHVFHKKILCCPLYRFPV